MESSRPMDKPDFERLMAEGRRIEESAMWSGQNQFEQAKIWRGFNYIIGIPSTTLGAIAGATTLATTVGRLWAGLAMLVAAALAAIMTLLKLARHTDEALVSANAYLAVQQDDSLVLSSLGRARQSAKPLLISSRSISK